MISPGSASRGPRGARSRSISRSSPDRRRGHCMTRAADAWGEPFWRALLRSRRGEAGYAFHFEIPAGARVRPGGAQPRFRVRPHRRRPQFADDARQLGLGRKLRLADILGQKRPFDAARGVPAAGALHDGSFGQVRQRADAPFDLLLWPVCDPWHERGRRARQPGLAWLHPAVAAERRDALCHGPGAGRADPYRRFARNPYRARGHRSETALGYAPVHHARTLNQWARNPLAR